MRGEKGERRKGERRKGERRKGERRKGQKKKERKGRKRVSNAQHSFLDNCGKGCGPHIIKHAQSVKQCARMAWMVRHKHSS